MPTPDSTPERDYAASRRLLARVAWLLYDRRLTELQGGFPAERSPLKAETLEVREFPKYRREKFVFQSRQDFSVLGYLLTPLEKKGLS